VKKKACIKCGKVGQREGPFCIDCAPMVTCPKCGRETPWYLFRHTPGSEWKCISCRTGEAAEARRLRKEANRREREREEQRQADEARQKALQELQQRLDRERLEECTLEGTCSVFKAHHEILANDPERLKTDFLIEMTCGVGGLKRYRNQAKGE